MSTLKTITVLIPEELHREVKMMTALNDLPIKGYVMDLIRADIQAHGGTHADNSAHTGQESPQGTPNQ